MRRDHVDAGALSDGGAAKRDSADRPRWLDRRRYPFDPERVALPAGAVSFVDEGTSDGDRPAVLFLHGNPTWSFLYRHLVRGLRDEYRCVAPDLPGFGLSAKPASFSYRPAALARTVRRFVDRLDLGRVALVVHDWGGPIGMDFATRNPESVAGVVASNTWCWPRERLFDRLSSVVTETALAGWLYRRHNAFVRAAIAPLVLAAALDRDFDRARALYRHYAGPFPTPESRVPTRVLSGQVGRSRAWHARLWDRRTALRETPVRLLWGARDPVHGPFLSRWERAFPRTESTVYDGAGHFVPEALGPAMVDPVRAFLERL